MLSEKVPSQLSLAMLSVSEPLVSVTETSWSNHAQTVNNHFFMVANSLVSVAVALLACRRLGSGIRPPLTGVLTIGHGGPCNVP